VKRIHVILVICLILLALASASRIDIRHDLTAIKARLDALEAAE